MNTAVVSTPHSAVHDFFCGSLGSYEQHGSWVLTFQNMRFDMMNYSRGRKLMKFFMVCTMHIFLTDSINSETLTIR